ncbi:PQQ-binding-like beta-propeller repeat protein [Pendulispora albinea]|uniref:PQQ-binding-like beta-propeller repeat protein n=1 Tax=Pendulispora albinea TaxID=2741071 RepID=A0ABZ2MAE3_9BACT
MKRRSGWAHRALALSVVLGLGATGAGCATADTANDRISPEVPLWYHRPANLMSVLVKRTVTAAGRTTGEDWERGRTEIDARHGRIFLGTADHGFYALRAGDGSTIWRFETLGVVQCEPLYDPELDIVYFGSHDGALYAVRAFDGSLVWRFFSGAEISRRPVKYGDNLYFANGADQLFAVDRRTGKKKWQAHRTSALGMEIAGYSGPAAAFGKVYLAYSDGHVVAYDARDGTERWTPVDLSAEAEQSSPSGEAPRYLDVDTTPVPDEIPGSGNVVYVASYAGGVFALDAESGARVWSNDQARGVTDLVLFSEPAHAPHPNGPDRDGPTVPARKLLLASSGTTGLWGLEPGTGKMVWRNDVPEGGVTAPVQIDGALLVGTTRYGLFLLSPRNGRVIDGFNMTTGFAQTPSAFGHRAYAMTNAGTLFGLQIEPPSLGPTAPGNGQNWP